MPRSLLLMEQTGDHTPFWPSHIFLLVLAPGSLLVELFLFCTVVYMLTGPTDTGAAMAIHSIHSYNLKEGYQNPNLGCSPYCLWSSACYTGFVIIVNDLIAIKKK